MEENRDTDERPPFFRLSLEDEIRELLCRMCGSGVLRSHTEQDLADAGWMKCPICGFSKKSPHRQVRPCLTPRD